MPWLVVVTPPASVATLWSVYVPLGTAVEFQFVAYP
jgi:hypothetical protein